MDAVWRIELLGGLRVQCGDRVVTRFPTQKTGLLLAYLAYYHQHPHPREALIEQLWPEIDLDASRASLRVALSSLRRLLEPPGTADGTLLIPSRAALSLDPTAFTTDVAEFNAALQAAARIDSAAERAVLLSRAIDLYRGELLPGHHEDWILTERQHLAEEHLQALQQLGAALEQAGKLQRALEVARRAVVADPLREEAHYDLMRLYAASGQPSAVLRQYRELERLLREELDETPSAATHALAEELRRRAHQLARLRAAGDGEAGRGSHAAAEPRAEPRADPLPEPAPRGGLGGRRLTRVERSASPSRAQPPAWPRTDAPLRPRPAFRRNLPVQLTRFIGRARELAEVQGLLGTTRFLTLTGPGGCGKTRLALQVAAELPEGEGEGIWLVELAPLSDPALVPQAVATALGVRSEPEKPLAQTLVEYLERRRLLLLLDNCEHLLSACAQLADTILRRCAQVSILATSREGLGILGEQTYRVPSLATPDPRRLPPLEQLREFEAVRLFADRALLAQPDFAVTGVNAEAVVQVCHQLDGIPLAIELAAARLKVLPVEQIAARLDDRFRLLTGGSRTALPRQQTLRAAIDWSYDLLSPAERVLLCRLSVFAGGFTLEAAEAVGAGEGLEAQEVLDLLSRLVEKSLVGYEAQRGEARYRLLETVRQYGREQLEEPERSDLERRHAEYFLTWAERAQEEVCQGREQQAWLERLEIEHDNLRAALAWAVERGQERSDARGEISLRLAVALTPFWERRGYFSEGRERLAAVLALADPSNLGEDAPHGLLSLRALALKNAGTLAWRQGDYGPARMLLEESLAMHRSLGDSGDVVSALHLLGAVTFHLSDFDASRDLGAQALAIAREIGATRHIAIGLYNLGNVAHAQSDYETARPLFTESLAVFRELGDRYSVAYALHGLGLVAHCQGDWGSARAFYGECLALRRELGDRAGVGEALHSLGSLARAQGDHAAARSCLEESLALRRELGDQRGIAMCLHGLGTVASQQGDEETAQALLEESLVMLRKQGDRHMAAGPLADLGALLARRGRTSRRDAGRVPASRRDAGRVPASRRDAGHSEPAEKGAEAAEKGAEAGAGGGAARAFLEESLAIFREAADRQGIGDVLCYLGTMALDQGEEDAAGSYYGESLAAYRAVGERYGIAQAMEGLARVADARREARQAAQLYAAAAALREALSAPVSPAERAAHERRIAAVCACLGEEDFAAAWAEGRAMPWEQVVEEALGRTGPPDSR